jgi:spore maturation protein SpmB
VRILSIKVHASRVKVMEAFVDGTHKGTRV